MALKKSYYAKKDEVQPRWYVIDAEGKVFGRLLSRIALVLQGKHKPGYTPNVDCGDFVIVLNADKVVFTGNKLENKKYYRHSGYPGGIRERSLGELKEKFPERLLANAVRGMLPKSRLGRQALRKLKVYTGSEHPHEAQCPEPLELRRN